VTTCPTCSLDHPPPCPAAAHPAALRKIAAGDRAVIAAVLTLAKGRTVPYDPYVQGTVPPKVLRRAVAPPPGNSLAIVAYLDSWTGYGQIAEWLGRSLHSQCVGVSYQSLRCDETYYPLSDFVRSRLAPLRPGWALQLSPPGTAIVAPGRTVAVTMWESSRIAAAAAAGLNGGTTGVVVPCEHNAEVMRASGVTVPVAVVPLGIDPATYFDDGTQPPDNGPFVFGGAGRLAHGGARKGLEDLAAAFGEAFPTQSDVRLELKVWPDCAIKAPADPRIKLVRRPMTPAEMAGWYRSSHVFCSASKGEGFGLQPLQAMAVGRPFLGCRHSGHAAYWHDAACYAVRWRAMPADGLYRGLGHWYVPERRSLVEQMRRAYADRAEVRAKGRAAAARAAEFPWSRTGRELAAVLREWGVLAEPAALPRAAKPRVSLAGAVRLTKG
jgi:hypothetical protein